MDRRTFLGAAALASLIPGLSRAGSALPSIVVWGDSLADGLWAGLSAYFRDAGTLSFVRKGKVSSGLVKTAFYDWPTEAVKLAAGPYAAAVAMIGLNDHQPMDGPGGRYPFGSRDWDDEYGQRVATIATAFRDHGMPLVWLGLPVCRDESYDVAARRIDGILEQEVPAYDGIYVSTREATAGKDGKFSTYLPDGRGQKVEMRLSDGNHFSGMGYQLLAGLVAETMRGDPRLAKLA